MPSYEKVPTDTHAGNAEPEESGPTMPFDSLADISRTERGSRGRPLGTSPASAPYRESRCTEPLGVRSGLLGQPLQHGLHERMCPVEQELEKTAQQEDSKHYARKRVDVRRLVLVL
jgi:hypothetical protein